MTTTSQPTEYTVIAALADVFGDVQKMYQQKLLPDLTIVGKTAQVALAVEALGLMDLQVVAALGNFLLRCRAKQLAATPCDLSVIGAYAAFQGAVIMRLHGAFSNPESAT